MKLATIEKIDKLYQHPNADKLEICEVLGYQCVVPIGLHKEGDIIVFIQPDTCLPKDQEWAEEYIKYSPKRIKAVRLRQIWSEGVVAPMSKFEGGIDLPWKYEIGDEVSQYIGVTKYEPPLPKDIQAKGGLPYQIPKTDEDRWENQKSKLPYGELVDISLKVDGQSCVSENTLLITDKGLITIKEICESKYLGYVLSYNERKEMYEFQQIINHSIQENNGDWYEIIDENNNQLIITGNHEIYIPDLNCYRRINELDGHEKLLII